MNGEGSREGGGERDVVHTLLGGAAGVRTGLGGVVNPELAGGTEEALIEKTLLSIQEKVCLASFSLSIFSSLSHSVTKRVRVLSGLICVP